MFTTVLVLGVTGILAVLAGVKVVGRHRRGQRRPPAAGDPMSGTDLARRVTPADYVPRDRLGSEDFR